MLGETNSIEGVLMEFLTPILPKIGGDPTREALINLHQLISGNAASMVSNLVGGHHRHLALTMTAEEYMEQTGYTFVPPHNPGNYPPMMGTAQEQVLRTKRFRENQVIFRIYTAVGGSLKNQIVMVVKPVFLSPLVEQFIGFRHVSALVMLQSFSPPTGQYIKLTSSNKQ